MDRKPCARELECGEIESAEGNSGVTGDIGGRECIAEGFALRRLDGERAGELALKV